MVCVCVRESVWHFVFDTPPTLPLFKSGDKALFNHASPFPLQRQNHRGVPDRTLLDSGKSAL